MSETSLFHARDPVTEIFYVVEGRVQLLRSTGTGGTLLFQTAVAGDVVAEASGYSSRYHCDAVASGHTTVTVIPKAMFLRALHEDLELSENWCARLAMGVQSARTLAEIRTLRTVRERLQVWQALGGDIPERGKWHELAARLGVSREALYREMALNRT